MTQRLQPASKYNKHDVTLKISLNQKKKIRGIGAEAGLDWEYQVIDLLISRYDKMQRKEPK